MSEIRTINFFNTKSLSKEKFVPIEPGKVKMYVCGPTVYNYLHIGNFRGAIVFNLLRNYLEHIGYDVTYAYNYTDVDDKIIQKAKDENRSPNELTEFYIKEFEKDFSDLKLKKHDHNPKVTNFIPQIVKFIQDLIEQGKAYEVDGEVFYEINKFEAYGLLSKKKLDDLEAGNRVEVDQRKRNPFDFVLWKPAKEGEISWDSPWSKGRPGWHIECSAMIQDLLGETIDIHGGGIDLIFPHHENEIAQGEGRTNKPYCNYWLHNNFINVNDEKMSKSLGNFVTARDFNTKYHPEILKYMFLSVHYRSVFSVNQEKIIETIKALDRVYHSIQTAKIIFDKFEASEVEKASAQSSVTKKLSLSQTQIEKALADDLNSADMISKVFETVRFFNGHFPKINKANVSHAADAQSYLSWIQQIGEMTALFGEDPDKLMDRFDEILLREKQIDQSKVNELIRQREQAREEKNWKLADDLRNKLDEIGIEIFDGEAKSFRVKR
ncbi:cysteine--tRNA ligase [Bacteriovoracaceae bacterium]|nr:cysteine--tRNA ligase [Bacteriovoracaceae bacterium]